MEPDACACRGQRAGGPGRSCAQGPGARGEGPPCGDWGRALRDVSQCCAPCEGGEAAAGGRH
eukprot:14078228-Alexandrium_andersonii.AAC.1